MKEKGFTLIELLAVIVILAIIALIATPIILNIISDTKEESIYRSAEMYLSALDNSIASLSIDKEKINDGTYDILENGNACLVYSGNECTKELNIEVKGEKPESGKITIEKGIVVDFELVYKDKIIKKDANGKWISENNPYKQVQDNNPGIICGEGNKEDTTQEKCYVKSIEDLVAFSNIVNKGTNFEGKTVELEYSLDFNNTKSYSSGEVDESLTTGSSFRSIGQEHKPFKGTFEGNNNTIKGLYINRPESNGIGLFGHTENATIQNLNIEDINLTGYRGLGALAVTNKGGIIQNIKANNIKINAYMYSGGLIYNNSGTVKDIEIENVEISGDYDYIAGLIGANSGGIVENIKLNNIVVDGAFSPGGVIGTSGSGTIKNIIGNNIIVNTSSRGAGGLVGYSDAAITQINLTNIEINGNDWAGALVGRNRGSISFVRVTNSTVSGASNYVGGLIGFNEGVLENAKFSGNVIGNYSPGLGVAYNNLGNIKNIVVKGNIEGVNDVGGLVGNTIGTSADELSTVSGVYLSGSITGTGKNINRTIGTATHSLTNSLASSSILVNENTVSSSDIAGLHGKSLTDMGIASQKEYEVIGFKFESTDTNDWYWYFNEKGELDLKIKAFEG